MAFMRHNNNGRRHNNNRHRHNNNGQQQGQRRHVNRINQVFESNGPDGRVRGTAQQIVEKYTTMARDAQSSGDKVLSMNYFQHAEHYQRLLNEITEENAVFEREREAQRAAQQVSQPDISAEDAESGFADIAADQEEGKEASQGNRQPRAQQRNMPQRAPRRKDEGDDDLNVLPGFLQVPITESAPPAAKQGDDADQPAKPRAVRTRRTATVTKEETAE